MLRLSLYAATAVSIIAAAPAFSKTITISIGYQSMCTDTYPAGTVLKGLGLLQKYLPHTGKYAGVDYHIIWRNYSSGAPITNMMMAGKLDFGTMGDYPLVVNGSKFQQTSAKRSYLITMTGYNLDGAGNGIVVPTKSKITDVKQLEGQTISTPIGSSSWGMLYEMAADNHIPFSSFHVVNQSPMAGIAAITAGKIAAHADFCPISELMEYKQVGKLIYSGMATHVPYLHGAVVTASFADKYPAIVVAYDKAVIDADRWISSNPYQASKMIAKWTMVPKEVLYLYFSHGGYLTLDPKITQKWIKTLQYDHQILAKNAGIPALNFNEWVNPKYQEIAYKQLGLKYGSAHKVVYNPKDNINLPPEIWVQGGGIQKYGSVGSMLMAAKADIKAHKKINATYVYDHTTGLKLFGNYAYYVKMGHEYTAFMTAAGAKSNAHGAPVYSYQQIISTI
ncbi:ABC transporter substrate-binding protein [Acidithiobacillus ferrianus]|uniref:ABC transporter substrate-binding protein n=1 Tax=Acidithiobacillus ferrianus TaxID=2678518 RepID=UPI0034E383AA